MEEYLRWNRCDGSFCARVGGAQCAVRAQGGDAVEELYDFTFGGHCHSVNLDATVHSNYRAALMLAVSGASDGLFNADGDPPGPVSVTADGDSVEFGETSSKEAS